MPDKSWVNSGVRGMPNGGVRGTLWPVTVGVGGAEMLCTLFSVNSNGGVVGRLVPETIDACAGDTGGAQADLLGMVSPSNSACVRDTIALKGRKSSALLCSRFTRCD